MEGHEDQIKSLLRKMKNVCQSLRWICKKYGLLPSRGKDEECLKKLIKKRLTSCEKGFHEPIKRSGIQIIKEKKNPREISDLKEGRL